MRHEGDGDRISEWCALYSNQMIGTGSGGLGNKRMNEDYPNHSNIKIGQNIERPGHLETCCHSNSCEKPSAKAGVKNFQKRKIIRTMIIRLGGKSNPLGGAPEF